jgi:hypothetical protein
MPPPPRRKNARKGNASTRARDSRKTSRQTTKQPGGNLYSITLDASTGEVVTVETLNAAGSRRKVSERQRKSLAREGRERFEEALVEAFEAGIDCVLGDENDQSESDEVAKLRRDLAAPLMQRSPASRLLKRDVLDRAVLGTLMQHSINSLAGQPARAD